MTLPPHPLSPPCSDPKSSLESSPSHVSGSAHGRTDLPDRFTRIADRIARHAAMSPGQSTALHHHLDCIESLLDPRPPLTQETRTAAGHSAPSESALPDAEVAPSAAIPSSPSLGALMALLHEATALNAQLQRRRSESFHLYDRLTRECQRLTHGVSVLQHEFHSLHADIQEVSLECEALHGTVQGLESWFIAWHAQHGPAVARKLSSPRRRWSKPNMGHDYENEIDILLEGFTAWMRGWSDLKDGFRARERIRQQAMDERRRIINSTGIFISR
ncbi:hypothetical protein BDV59DRAFT_37193 [Aspergillus ambiguus]|uniref:uncharacterized protein n=1 Tax=Aspergillus ambiguus TaxID=176160 RepID=UPI003CCD2772